MTLRALAVIHNNSVVRERRSGKVRELEIAAEAAQVNGHIGIAHTRWATHGAPTKIMPIRMSLVILPLSITALLKIMKNYAMN